MDPYNSPYIIPNNNPYNPFLHSLPSTREFSTARSNSSVTPCRLLEIGTQRTDRVAFAVRLSCKFRVVLWGLIT